MGVCRTSSQKLYVFLAPNSFSYNSKRPTTLFKTIIFMLLTTLLINGVSAENETAEAIEEPQTQAEIFILSSSLSFLLVLLFVIIFVIYTKDS